MFSIHIFNVGHGDSIILETKIAKKSYYSIIDCKKVGLKTPIVEFLKKKKIKNIHSLFLTHFHSDHCSGLPQLRDYLIKNKGTLEFFISPYLPDEIDLKKHLWSVLYDDSTRIQRKEIIMAMGDIQKLSSLTDDNKQVLSVRILYEGNNTSSAWQSHLHPGLLFAPVNPNPEEAIQYLRSVIKEADLGGKAINSLSHTFMFQYNRGANMSIAAFTGDLEGRAWRTIKNRCLNITQDAIKDNLRFLKSPHHGALNPSMAQSLAAMINSKTRFVASISCGPAKSQHPHKKTLTFIKNQFPLCEIACTNITSHCHTKGLPSIPQDILQQTEKDIDFMECAMSAQSFDPQSSQPGACAGDHIFSISGNEYTLNRSTGLPCAL